MLKSKAILKWDVYKRQVNVLSEVDRAVAIAAYENIANTFNENIIKSTIDNWGLYWLYQLIIIDI